MATRARAYQPLPGTGLKQALTFVSPRLALQKGDFLGSGVPYWPIELATLAAHVRESGETVILIDLFGNDPRQLEDRGDHYLQGESIDRHLARGDVRQSDAFILYAISYMSHSELLAITCVLRQTFPLTPIAILENSQAVTAYSLQRVAEAFLDAGADLLICGEPYFNWNAIKQCLRRPLTEPLPENLVSRDSIRPPRRITRKGARYPVPAWDLVNLQGYWSLPYAHGPKTPRYLPILTSRGCPYPCDFCVVPETNNRAWRGNDAKQVVDEIIALRDRYGVRDFQVEDLNPTVQHLRWEAICEELIERNADVRFYLVSGTKAETLRIDKLALLARAGCRYISISPESGSARLMKTIGKPFDYSHGVELVAACRKHAIRTQACLLVGHPAESEPDFVATRNYLVRLVRAGLDEVAVFIVAPFAGSALHARNGIEVDNRLVLPSFTPRGRADFPQLERRRRALIRTFFGHKLLRGLDLWRQGFRALAGIPQTKMENLPKRIAFVVWLVLQGMLARRWGRRA